MQACVDAIMRAYRQSIVVGTPSVARGSRAPNKVVVLLHELPVAGNLTLAEVMGIHIAVVSLGLTARHAEDAPHPFAM